MTGKEYINCGWREFLVQLDTHPAFLRPLGALEGGWMGKSSFFFHYSLKQSKTKLEGEGNFPRASVKKIPSPKINSYKPNMDL